LALLLLEASKSKAESLIVDDWQGFGDAVRSKYKVINLMTVVMHIWDVGIPILPLCDAGRFHGACWRVGGRNVIVVKQRTISQARWLFDVLHEFFHACKEPETDERARVDIGETGDESRHDEEEGEANDFAANVMLDGRAEELAQSCVDAANGRVEYLKRAVPEVAIREGVSHEALANYMAFRLSLQGINWWGTASRLQRGVDNPFEIVRDILLAKADIDSLNEIDRNILMSALSVSEVVDDEHKGK
jgi:Zn-dependent peptidase ImmA (M78 family)